jgi:dienelactone hydrolase
MRRVGLILLSLVFFALSSARLSLGERPTTADVGTTKGDLQQSVQTTISEPTAIAGDSEEQAVIRSAESYAAFEDVWTALPSSQISAASEEIPAFLMQEAQAQWAFAPATTPEEGRGKATKPLPDRADNAATRIYVLYGQYGWTTSAGMYSLAQSLARYGEVSVHQWDDRTIVQDAKRHSGKIVIIGYSLGANSTVAIANKLPQVDLIVAYDPSRLSPLAHEVNGEFTQHVKPTVRRAICFYNPYAWYFGGARLAGSSVEVVPISNFHLAVAVDQRLHDITEEAVKQVALGSPAKESPTPEPANTVAATQPGKQVSSGGVNSVSRTAARASMPNS